MTKTIVTLMLALALGVGTLASQPAQAGEAPGYSAAAGAGGH